MRIAIFSHLADTSIDEPMVRKKRSYVKDLLSKGLARIIDGKTEHDTGAVQLFAPIENMHVKTEMETKFGWNPPFGRYRSTALNEGRAGQFSIGYPIPFGWEGSMSPMRVAVVNAEPDPA